MIAKAKASTKTRASAKPGSALRAASPNATRTTAEVLARSRSASVTGNVQ
jgi:hypothetical protein